MIQLKCIISNPWRKFIWNSVASSSHMLSTHKAVEFEVLHDSTLLFYVDVSITTHKDHGGAELSIGVFGYSASVRLYDTRHWDGDNNTWEK